MIAHHSYIQLAVNTTQLALEKGASLENDFILGYGANDNDGKAFYHVFHKVLTRLDGTDEMKTIYEGRVSSDAAKQFVNICGVFAAMGLATKWIRNNR